MIDDLKVAISEKDVNKARNILVNEILGTNYPYEVFTDAMDLAEQCSIFEGHNKEKLISDSKLWDEDYLEQLIEGLTKNFSKERFLKAYNVARKLEKNQERNLEESCQVEVSKDYKDFLLLAKVGAVVAGACAIGAALWYLKRKKNE